MGKILKPPAVSLLLEKTFDRSIEVFFTYFPYSQQDKVFKRGETNAAENLIKKAKKEFGGDILFLSPDKGGKRRTNILGAKKRRINSFKTEMVLPRMDFQGKTIGVIDDLLETGATLSKFSELVKKAGAKKNLALITHGVLTSGIRRIQKDFSKLYLTNTIKQKGQTVDITGLILELIS